MSSRPLITLFDNEKTFLLKWAIYWQVPSRMILVYDNPPEQEPRASLASFDNMVFTSAVTIINNLFNQGYTPIDIYDESLKFDLDRKLSKDDIIMLYYGIYLNAHPLAAKNPIEQKALVNMINDYYIGIDETTLNIQIASFEDLTSKYDNWYLSEYLHQMEIDQHDLNRAIHIQNCLEKISQKGYIPAGPLTITSAILKFNPTIAGKPVDHNYGFEIFDNSILSKYIPYIQYNGPTDNKKEGQSERYYKIYQGVSIDTTPNYHHIIIPSNDTTLANTIYLTLWIGDPFDKGEIMMHNSPRNLFYTVIYQLDTNTMRIESTTDKQQELSEDIAVKRVQASLPSIQLGPGKEVKVRGDFTMWNINFSESSFIDLILNDPLLNTFLYLGETIKPFPVKKRLNVHYQPLLYDNLPAVKDNYISNFSAVSININQLFTIEENKVTLINPIQNDKNWTENIPVNTPYMEIHIIQALSRKTIERFLMVFSVLLQYYKNTYLPIEEEYNQLIPGLNILDNLLEARKRIVEVADSPTVTKIVKRYPSKVSQYSNIDQLQKEAPDLFIANYAWSCQGPYQPQIIKPPAIREWQAKGFTLRGIEYPERQILKYPKHGPRQWLFVCPNDQYPFPSLKINDNKNNMEFPYLPCCAKKDHMHDPNSNYTAYMTDQPIKKKGVKAVKEIKTYKILPYGQQAHIPKGVKNLLNNYDPMHGTFSRIGVPYSPNSLIHSICLAIDDQEYLAYSDDDQREIHVKKIRQMMSTTIYPDLLRQELFTNTNSQITEKLLDVNSYFDSNYFYRTLEEIYNINIYVFSPHAIGDEQGQGHIDIPRHHIFHARPYRPNKPTVLILRNYGSTSDNLEFPQYELIVDYFPSDKTMRKIFDTNMTLICHKALKDTISTLTWISGSAVRLQRTGLIAHQDIYMEIDHLSLLPYKAISQYIDGNGKLRALTFDVGNNSLLTLITIPSQPENLPVRDKISLIDYKTAIKIFGPPVAITKNISGEVNGLWYEIMDIMYGEYVPIKPIHIELEKPLGPSNPLTIPEEDIIITGRLQKMRKIISYIIQLFKWLYDLANINMPVEPQLFMTRYVVVDNNNTITDSANYYDFSRLPRKLPDINSPEAGINNLEKYIPTFIRNGKIVLYNDEFYQKIFSVLNQYYRESFGLAPNPAIFINDYYSSANDFKPQNNVIIIVGDRDLAVWIGSLTRSTHIYNIRDKIEPTMEKSPDPFLYRDSDGKIYMIQNVMGGDIYRALAVAESWATNQYNLGYDAEPLAEIKPHFQYSISKSNRLVPLSDHTVGSNIYYQIVSYNQSRYAAMLPIL